MTDEDNSTVDALGHNAMASDDGNMDADFGALEMFDSNAAAADDAPPPSSSVADGAEGGRKHRKKKDKKKKAKDVPYEEGEHRRAKRRHAPEADAAVAHEDDEPAEEEQEETAETNGGEKRKRRSSDGGAAAEEGKRRKKKRKAVAAAEEEEPVHEGDEFLHKDHPPHAAVAEEDSGDDEFASAQGSPSAAHARRLSQVHDEQEREKALSNMDVENLAREAFNEHMNGSNNNNGAPDVEMQDAAGAAEQEEAEAESRPKRSTRKKAKPSFFEQPQDEEEYPEEGLEGDLPSPSALTPKPRKRTKAATKKTARRRNGDDDDEAEAKGPFDINDIDQPSGRRNRMEGFTKGRFTDEELAAITKQVQAFAQEHELSQHEVNEVGTHPLGHVDTNHEANSPPDDPGPRRHERGRGARAALEPAVCRVPEAAPAKGHQHYAQKVPQLCGPRHMDHRAGPRAAGHD